MKRRSFLKTGGLMAAAMPMAGANGAGVSGVGMSGGGGLAVHGLTADGIAQPLGLDHTPPRLGWRMESATQDTRQTAYRITMASRAQDLVTGASLLWDSGRVASAQTVDVPCGAPTFAPRQRVWWCVEVWDNHGRHAMSAPAWFERGLDFDGAWPAQWIEVETDEARADREAHVQWIWSANALDERLHGFRLTVDVPADCRGADLLVSGKDHLRGVWVNGVQSALARPLLGHSHPAYWGSMAAFAAPLVPGRNVIAVAVAADTTGFFPVDGGAMAALVRLRHADGRVERIASGPLWRVLPDPPLGWQAAGFDDQAWPRAQRSTSAAQGDPREAEPAIQMRRRFTVSRPVVRARLYATALGAYQCHVNGKRTDDAVLAPEICVARDHLFYQIHDVTTLIGQGDNVLCALVGSGWYASAFGWRMERYGFGPAPRRFLAMLVIDHPDGTTTTIASDDQWRWHVSPVLFSEIYHGERYDARLATPGWTHVPFDDAAWRPVRMGAAPHVPLIAQTSPPLRATQSRAPLSTRRLADGAMVYDFGQNMAGWARLNLTGMAAGQELTLRFAEVLAQDGHVDMRNLRGADCTDHYVATGHGEEVWEPSFTYHGFRYVQVDGLGTQPAANAVTAIVVGSDCAETGRMTFARSPLLQRIWNNALWSQRSNFFAVPTDCPQRDERMGWMGDIQVFLDAAAFNMDVDGFIRRFLVEVRAAQRADGAYPIVVPQPLSFPDVVTAGWSEAGIILPYMLWQRYGDTRVIEENWAAMARWMDYVTSHSQDDLWVTGRGLDLGDWLSVDAVRPDDETTPRAVCAAAYHARCADLMAQMARATGRADEERRYRALRGRIGNSFARHFINEAGVVGAGLPGGGSQTSQALALSMGLVPPALRGGAVAHLAQDIAARGMKLSTGFLGTPCLLDVLADGGRWDVVEGLLTQTGYPGWGYMPGHGATTMWERWNGDSGDLSMNSYNHYAFGALVGFLYRRLGGIAPDAPGFARIRVAPRYLPAVGPVEAQYDAVTGRIATRVEGDGQGMSMLALTVPANVSATVVLPGAAWRDGAGHVWRGRDGHEVLVDVGSGNHRFVRAGA